MGRDGRDDRLRARLFLLESGPERCPHQSDLLVPWLDHSFTHGDGRVDLLVDRLALVLDPAVAAASCRRRVALRKDSTRRRSPTKHPRVSRVHFLAKQFDSTQVVAPRRSTSVNAIRLRWFWGLLRLRHSSAFAHIEQDFAEANGMRSDFDAFIIGDEFQRLL